MICMMAELAGVKLKTFNDTFKVVLKGNYDFLDKIVAGVADIRQITGIFKNKMLWGGFLFFIIYAFSC